MVETRAPADADRHIESGSAVHGVSEMVGRGVQSVARSVWRLACVGAVQGPHISRYAMYASIKRQMVGHDLGPKVLSISHSTDLCKMLGAREGSITEAAYPEHSICKLSAFESDTCTAVVSDQVLEHIGCTPETAIDEVYRVLSPGGIAVHTTCFLTPYHGSSNHGDCNNGDYWRFTSSGLRLLHKRYSKVIAADGWGNPLVPLINGLGLGRMPVPEPTWHPLNKLARLNRRSYAYVVWVIAQK